MHVSKNEPLSHRGAERMILQLTFNYQIPAEQLNSFTGLPEHTQTRRPQRLGKRMVLSGLWERRMKEENISPCVCFCMCDTVTDHQTSVGEEWAYACVCMRGESDCRLTSGVITGFNNIMTEGGGPPMITILEVTHMILFIYRRNKEWIRKESNHGAYTISRLTVSGCLILGSCFAYSLTHFY